MTKHRKPKDKTPWGVLSAEADRLKGGGKPMPARSMIRLLRSAARALQCWREALNEDHARLERIREIVK